MQFAIIAYDGEDNKAFERRQSSRDAHLMLAKQMKNAGKLLYAAALINEQGKMHGSIMVLDMPNREEIDKWLKSEPYVINEVWEKIEVKECKVAPIFQTMDA